MEPNKTAFMQTKATTDYSINVQQHSASKQIHHYYQQVKQPLVGPFRFSLDGKQQHQQIRINSAICRQASQTGTVQIDNSQIVKTLDTSVESVIQEKYARDQYLKEKQLLKHIQSNRPHQQDTHPQNKALSLQQDASQIMTSNQQYSKKQRKNQRRTIKSRNKKRKISNEGVDQLNKNEYGVQEVQEYNAPSQQYQQNNRKPQLLKKTNSKTIASSQSDIRQCLEIQRLESTKKQDEAVYCVGKSLEQVGSLQERNKNQRLTSARTKQPTNFMGLNRMSEASHTRYPAYQQQQQQQQNQILIEEYTDNGAVAYHNSNLRQYRIPYSQKTTAKKIIQSQDPHKQLTYTNINQQINGKFHQHQPNQLQNSGGGILASHNQYIKQQDNLISPHKLTNNNISNNHTYSNGSYTISPQVPAYVKLSADSQHPHSIATRLTIQHQQQHQHSLIKSQNFCELKLKKQNLNQEDVNYLSQLIEQPKVFDQIKLQQQLLNRQSPISNTHINNPYFSSSNKETPLQAALQNIQQTVQWEKMHYSKSDQKRNSAQNEFITQNTLQQLQKQSKQQTTTISKPFLSFAIAKSQQIQAQETTPQKKPIITSNFNVIHSHESQKQQFTNQIQQKSPSQTTYFERRQQALFELQNLKQQIKEQNQAQNLDNHGTLRGRQIVLQNTQSQQISTVTENTTQQPSEQKQKTEQQINQQNILLFQRNRTMSANIRQRQTIPQNMLDNKSVSPVKNKPNVDSGSPLKKAFATKEACKDPKKNNKDENTFNIKQPSYTHLQSHKTNILLQQANEFILETFIRPNDQVVNLQKIKQICQFFGFKVPKNVINDPATVKNKEFQIFAKEKILQKLYLTINNSNEVSQESVVSQQQMLRKFYVGKGNNYTLVRSVFKQRWWWQIYEEEDFEFTNFIWTSWRRNNLIDYLKTNDNLIGQQKQSTNSNDVDNKIRIYNRLEDNFHLSNKKALFFNMCQFYTLQGKDPFQVLPLTFHIEHGVSDPEYDKFKQYFGQIEQQKAIKKQELEKKKQIHQAEKADDEYDSEEEEEVDEEELYNVHVPKNIWIMKPGENSNRGNGIFVCNTLREVQAEIVSAAKFEHTHIIQKYIERPLLIHNRKFDIRVFGMFTSINSFTKGYFYEDGYIRTSCKEFSLDNLSNRFVHLTNDAVQKKSDDYGKFENGNKVSYHNFQKYLDTNCANKNINFFRDLLPQIKRIITDTFRATFLKLDPKRRQHSFEIFGYDFMIDADFNVYLIEANTNPCLELSCPLLARIIPAMLDNAFRLSVDPLFPPPDFNMAKKNILHEIMPINKYELVFDEKVDGAELRELLKNQEEMKLKIDVNDEVEEEEEMEEEERAEANREDYHNMLNEDDETQDNGDTI